MAVSNDDIFRTYLERFTAATSMAPPNSSPTSSPSTGPILQAKDKAEFLAGSAMAASMARGCTIHHQWVDGDDVCSIYDFEIETPPARAPSRWPNGR